MEVRVRRAEERDIPRIAGLLLQVAAVHAEGRPDLFKKGSRKYSDEQLSRILADEKTPVFVAVDDADAVLGYAFCMDATHPDDSLFTPVRTLYVDDICVDEKARGKGVGRGIYAFVRAWAKAEGYHNITLNVWSCNPTATRFYLSLGLTPYKVGMEDIL